MLPTLKLSTQRGYRMVLRKHLVPYWGERRLCDITKIDVQQFVMQKFEQQLAWQTVRNTWIVRPHHRETPHGFSAAGSSRSSCRKSTSRIGQ